MSILAQVFGSMPWLSLVWIALVFSPCIAVMPPKKGGGIRQRLGYDAKKDESKNTQAAEGIVKSIFKKGRISAKGVQGTSAAIVQVADSSASSSSQIADWATAGGEGSREKNMSRGVINNMGKHSAYPEVYASPCTFWDKASQSQVKDDMHYLLVHEVLDYQIGDDPIEEWTELPLGHPLHTTKKDWMVDVGASGDGQDIAMAGWWGDSAVYNTRDSLYVVLFNIISGIHHARFWVSAFSKRACCDCGCKGRCTWECVWHTLA